MISTALRIDAAGSAGSGVLLTAAAGILSDPFGVPSAVLVALGVFLLGYAAALEFIARGLPRTVRLVRVVVAGNLLWAAGSVVVALVAPLTALGTVVVLIQAIAVLAVARLQSVALRRRTVAA